MGFPTGDSIRAKNRAAFHGNGSGDNGNGSRHHGRSRHENFGYQVLRGFIDYDRDEYDNGWRSSGKRYGYAEASPWLEDKITPRGRYGYRYDHSGRGTSGLGRVLGRFLGDVIEGDSDYRRPRYRYEDERRYRGREDDPRDLNHDGRVTRDERELFNAVDRDGNGRLNRDERRELRELDRNGDGKLDGRYRRSSYEDGGYGEAPMRSRQASVSWEDGQPVFRDEHRWDLASLAMPQGAREQARRVVRAEPAAYVPYETPADRSATALPDSTSNMADVSREQAQQLARMGVTLHDGVNAKEFNQVLSNQQLVSNERLAEMAKELKTSGTVTLRNGVQFDNVSAEQAAAAIAAAIQKRSKGQAL